MDNAEAIYGEDDTFQLAGNRDDALLNADALIIATEWRQFRSPDWELLRRELSHPVIFDGRNMYDPARVAREGFDYYGIGLQSITAGNGPASEEIDIDRLMTVSSD